MDRVRLRDSSTPHSTVPSGRGPLHHSWTPCPKDLHDRVVNELCSEIVKTEEKDEKKMFCDCMVADVTDLW